MKMIIPTRNNMFRGLKAFNLENCRAPKASIMAIKFQDQEMDKSGESENLLNSMKKQTRFILVQPEMRKFRKYIFVRKKTYVLAKLDFVV